MTLAATTADRPTDRREQILVAAERVFAEHGYHGTTMRMIASRAEVKLSLIMYHFEAKLRLYREIFLRRQYVNDRRRELLARVDLTAADALDGIVAAFVDPVLALHEHPDDLWYARLVLRESSDPSSQDRGIIQELFDPMAREFITAIATAVAGAAPDHAVEFARWAYLFAVGALTQSSLDARIDDLTATGTPTGIPADSPPCAPGDPAVKAAYLRRFIRAGWSAVTG